MRVDGTPGSQSSLGLNRPNANRVAPSDAGGHTNHSESDGEFQPSADFVPLLDALKQIPQVRQEVVGEVARRLNGGEPLTPQARQQTVESVLGTGGA